MLKTAPALCFLLLSQAAATNEQLSVPERPCSPDMTEFPGKVTSSRYDRIEFSLNDSRSFTIEFGRPRQACRLPGQRILLLGDAGGRDTVVVVNLASGTLDDVFRAYSPAISPNRRWVIFRRFYPLQGVPDPSDQYMLYDLRKPSSENRVTDAVGLGAPGVEIYPVEDKFFSNVEVPDEEKHEYRSPFFWSADSKAVLFADLYQNKTDLILVTLEDNRHTALVLPVDPLKLCRESEKPDYIPLASARLTPLGPGGWEITAEFGSFCRPDPLIVSSDRFRPARVQEHRPLPPPKPMIMMPGKPLVNLQ